MSTDPAILGEVAEIAVNWLDLALHGNAAAGEAIATEPCASCPSGRWTVHAKHLDELVDTGS